MQPDATGKYPYTGSLDCAMKTLKSGGPFKFYTGFPVYCVRIAPHVMVMQIIHGVSLLKSQLFIFMNHAYQTYEMTPCMQMTWIFLNQIQKVEKRIGL